MTTQHEEMLKRFDEFNINELDCKISDIGKTRLDKLKAFIESEIDLAVANREKEIVEMIKEKWSGRLEIPNRYLTELFSLITNKSYINNLTE